MTRYFHNQGDSRAAKEQFKSEVTHWAAIMKVKPAQIRVQSMKKKWASCSNRGRICFSKDLLLESGAFQKYVIVHELLHLQVPNHGNLFKSLMNAYLPGWVDFGGAKRKCVIISVKPTMKGEQNETQSP